MSRECTNSPKERERPPPTCRNCNQEGHMSFDCPEPKPEREPMICFNCKAEGHGKRDCPEPIKPMMCFNCQ